MNQQHSMRINTKRAVVYLLAALYVGVIIFVVAERLDRLTSPYNEVHAATRQVTELDATRTKLTNDIRLHSEQSEGKLALIFLHGDKNKRVSDYGEMDKHNAAIDQAIAAFSPMLTNADEKEMLSRLVALRGTYRDNLHQAVDALELNDRENAQAIFSTSILNNLHDLQGLIAQLVKGERDSKAARQKEMLERNIQAEASLSRSRAITIGLGLGAAMIGLLLGIMLTRRVAAPH